MMKLKNRMRRNGVVVSTRFHWARLILYMFLIPILTWYGHQKYTNPFRLHPNIELPSSGNGFLALYETTFKDTLNSYRFYFDEKPSGRDSLEFLIHCSDSGFLFMGEEFLRTSFHQPNLSGAVFDSALTITYFDREIVVPFSKREKAFHKSVDLVIAKSDSLVENWRQHFAPRITALYESSDDIVFPENVIRIDDTKSYLLTLGKQKRLSLVEK